MTYGTRVGIAFDDDDVLANHYDEITKSPEYQRPEVYCIREQIQLRTSILDFQSVLDTLETFDYYITRTFYDVRRRFGGGRRSFHSCGLFGEVLMKRIIG